MWLLHGSGDWSRQAEPRLLSLLCDRWVSQQSHRWLQGTTEVWCLALTLRPCGLSVGLDASHAWCQALHPGTGEAASHAQLLLLCTLSRQLPMSSALSAGIPTRHPSAAGLCAQAGAPDSRQLVPVPHAEASTTCRGRWPNGTAKAFSMLREPCVLRTFLAAPAMQALLLLQRSDRWLHVTAAASPAGVSGPDWADQAGEWQAPHAVLPPAGTGVTSLQQRPWRCLSLPCSTPPCWEHWLR